MGGGGERKRDGKDKRGSRGHERKETVEKEKVKGEGGIGKET